MKATIKNLRLENFGRHSEAVGGKSLDFELGHKTVISGANATGKSTIKRAIYYTLGAKDENGKEITGIRPHDENGVDIDGLTTVAEMTVSVDGAENTLKRTCFQEKNRQGEYTSKDNLQYFVDDVKKGTKKAYEEFVQTIVPNMVCICANELLSKDTAERRAMLEPFSKHTSDDIIAENPDFKPLRGKLKANSTSDLKKACRDKIREKEKKRDEVITTIKVKEGSKKDIDLAELELHRNALNEQISKNKAKQEDISKEFEAQQKASDGILELKFELNDLQRKANEDLEKQRRELRNEESDLCHRVDREKSDIGYKKTQIHNCELHIKVLTADLEKAREEYTAKEKIEFDENDLTCKMCGQSYPAEKAVEIRMDFLNRKNDVLHEIATRGNSIKEELRKEKDILEKSKKELETLEKGLYEKMERIEKVREKMRELPDSIDISDRPEAQEIQRQIAEKEAVMNKGNSAEEIRQQLKDEYEELLQQKAEVDKQFDSAAENDRIDTEVEILTARQREISQEIADIEKELELLRDFERKKARLLEEDVNSNFSIIQWKMFKELQNGELGDICSPFVNGTSYDGNLNHGAKILAEIDICKAFQKKYDVCLPIIVDDCESLDGWRIPDIENQLIVFKWGESRELKIETEG